MGSRSSLKTALFLLTFQLSSLTLKLNTPSLRNMIVLTPTTKMWVSAGSADQVYDNNPRLPQSLCKLKWFQHSPCKSLKNFCQKSSADCTGQPKETLSRWCCRISVCSQPGQKQSLTGRKLHSWVLGSYFSTTSMGDCWLPKPPITSSTSLAPEAQRDSKAKSIPSQPKGHLRGTT